MTSKYKILFIISLLITIFLILFFSNATIKLLFNNKIWAHRINNINDFNKIQNKVDGIEADIIFYQNKNQFYVKHNKADPDNISLYKYFDTLADNKHLNYWLDFKNINVANTENSLKRLNNILINNQIEKNKIIIESKSFYGLSAYSDNGYITSYYIPSNLHLLDSININESINSIKAELNKTNINYISSTYKNYELLKTHFPDYKKLYWFTNYGGYSKLKTRIILFKICFNNKVDVLLMTFN